MKKEKMIRISMYDKADLSRDLPIWLSFYHFCGFKPLDFSVSDSLEGQFDTNCKKLKKNQNQNSRVDWWVSTTTVNHQILGALKDSHN